MMSRTVRRGNRPASLGLAVRGQSGARGWQAGGRLLGAVSLLALLLSASPASAQVRLVEILNADDVVVETDSLSGTIRRMTGNVRVRSDTTFLSANSAVEYVRRGEVILSGRVRIISGEDTLTASQVTYDKRGKLAVATGNVRIGAEGGVLFAPQAIYNSRDKRARFEGGGRLLQDGAELQAPSGTYETQRRFAEVDGPLTLRDSASTLTASRGTYDAETRRADVVGEVRLVRERDRLDADSLVYFRRTERARAFGDVILDRLGGEAQEDSLRRALLFGHRLIYDGLAETAQMEADSLSEALLVALERDSTGRVDTTLVRARTFYASREARDSLRVETLLATGGARMHRGNLSAVADSVSIVRLANADSLSRQPARDVADLLGGAFGLARPSVWVQGSQLAGDSLRIVSGAIRDSVFARGRAFAGSLDSTLGRVQQLAGPRMMGIVREEAIRRLHVWSGAEAIAYRATDEGRLYGAIRLGADSLVFRFDSAGELRELTASSDVQSTFTPGSLVQAETLPSFVFTPDSRPSRGDLLTGWEAAWLAAHPGWRHPDPSASPPPPREPGRQPNAPSSNRQPAADL